MPPKCVAWRLTSDDHVYSDVPDRCESVFTQCCNQMKSDSYLCFERTVVVKTAHAACMFEHGAEDELQVNKCWDAAKGLEARIMTII